LAPFFRYANYDALSLFVKVSITSYKDQSNAARKAQFSGWEDHMRAWGKRSNFRRVWRKAGFDPQTYDKRFYQHMNALVEAQPESGDEES